MKFLCVVSVAVALMVMGVHGGAPGGIALPTDDELPTSLFYRRFAIDGVLPMLPNNNRPVVAAPRFQQTKFIPNQLKQAMGKMQNLAKQGAASGGGMFGGIRQAMAKAAAAGKGGGGLFGGIRQAIAKAAAGKGGGGMFGGNRQAMAAAGKGGGFLSKMMNKVSTGRMAVLVKTAIASMGRLGSKLPVSPILAAATKKSYEMAVASLNRAPNQEDATVKQLRANLDVAMVKLTEGSVASSSPVIQRLFPRPPSAESAAQSDDNGGGAAQSDDNGGGDMQQMQGGGDMQAPAFRQLNQLHARIRFLQHRKQVLKRNSKKVNRAIRIDKRRLKKVRGQLRRRKRAPTPTRRTVAPTRRS